jgi:hypothetical protein
MEAGYSQTLQFISANQFPRRVSSRLFPLVLIPKLIKTRYHDVK